MLEPHGNQQVKHQENVEFLLVTVEFRHAREVTQCQTNCGEALTSPYKPYQMLPGLFSHG